MNNELSPREQRAVGHAVGRATGRGGERAAETVEAERWVAPPVDVYENEQEWLLLADLPGVQQDGLHLHLDRRELLIEGRRKVTGAGAPLAREFGATSYRRVFQLPSGVDAEKVAAEVKCGVLTLHLPKTEALRPRRVAVKAG
ncbi:MAG: Hsp20/alpha crystallin family protein [Proteobacteria bacterium]|nr:Hsp20/alpha crystallin family protein [Pseudomonadota bacterium]